MVRKFRKTADLGIYKVILEGKRIGKALYLGKAPQWGGNYDTILQQEDSENRVACWWFSEYSLEGKLQETIKISRATKVKSFTPDLREYYIRQLEKAGLWRKVA